MKIKKIFLTELARRLGAATRGNDRLISGVVPPEDARPDAICVVWDLKELDKIPPDCPVLTKPEGAREGLVAENPRMLLPELLQIFQPERTIKHGVHPSSIVSKKAKVSKTACVAAYCVIGPGVEIHDGVQIEPHVYIESGCVIGENTVIESNVSIRRAKIGKNCILHSGCVIGTEGFGFIPTVQGVVKIPQVGGVVIGDSVEIGACTCIDCGTIGNTIIGDGTRMDNQVQIAHNCKIGKNCLFCGKSAVAGSTEIGDNVIFAAEAAARDHVKIGSNSQIAGRAGVTHNIPEGAVVSGYPAREHRSDLKSQAYVARLPGLVERVKKIEKILEVKDDLS